MLATRGAYAAKVGPLPDVPLDVGAAVTVAEPYAYLYEVDVFIAPDVSAICAAIAKATVYWDSTDATQAHEAVVTVPEPRNGDTYAVSVALLDLRPTHGVDHIEFLKGQSATVNGARKLTLAEEKRMGDPRYYCP